MPAQDFKSHVISANSVFNFKETGISYDFSNYKEGMLAAEQHIKALGFEPLTAVVRGEYRQEYQQFLEDTNSKDDDYSVDEFYEQNFGRGAGENTYNWAYHGPTMNFYEVGDMHGENLFEVKVHLGGDVRANYSIEYLIPAHGSSFIEMISEVSSASVSADIDFDDGSSLSFYGNQVSDGLDLELANGMNDVSDGSIAEQVANEFIETKSHSSYSADEFIDEIMSGKLF
jgi:hypothetical protein